MVKCLEVSLCSQPELKIVCPNILLSDGTTKRVDEIAKRDHYNQWEKDFIWWKKWAQSFCATEHPTTKLMQVQRNRIALLQILLLTGLKIWIVQHRLTFVILKCQINQAVFKTLIFPFILLSMQKLLQRGTFYYLQHNAAISKLY